MASVLCMEQFIGWDQQKDTKSWLRCCGRLWWRCNWWRNGEKKSWRNCQHKDKVLRIDAETNWINRVRYLERSYRDQRLYSTSASVSNPFESSLQALTPVSPPTRCPFPLANPPIAPLWPPHRHQRRPLLPVRRPLTPSTPLPVAKPSGSVCASRGLPVFQAFDMQRAILPIERKVARAANRAC